MPVKGEEYDFIGMSDGAWVRPNNDQEALDEVIQLVYKTFGMLSTGPTMFESMRYMAQQEVDRFHAMGLFRYLKNPLVTVEFDGPMRHVSINLGETPSSPMPVVKSPPPSTPFDPDWECRMDREECAWIWEEIRENLRAHDFYCVDNYRAARMWISSQRRRFRKLEARGCCGSMKWVAKRWNVSKGRVDLYLLGFNYGH